MKAKLFLLMFLLLPVTSFADVVTLECSVQGFRWFPDSEIGLMSLDRERLSFDIDTKKETVHFINRSQTRKISSRQDYWNSREIFVLDNDPPKLLYGADQPHYAYESVGFLFNRSDLTLMVLYYREVDGAKDVSVCKRYPERCTKNDTLISYYDKSSPSYKKCKKLKAQF
jgi:hypothetical protein